MNSFPAQRPPRLARKVLTAARATGRGALWGGALLVCLGLVIVGNVCRIFARDAIEPDYDSDYE